ncbi:MAG: hypothetical protein MK193_08800 [Lentisphaeria bacterium]|nr:hypothetical protein [Lentisphaeria bacterium]
MPYYEKKAPSLWLLTGVLSWIIFYIPSIGLFEYSYNEAMLLLTVKNFSWGSPYFTEFLGHTANQPPILVWILAIASEFIILNEFTVRLLLGAIPILFIAIICSILTRRLLNSDMAGITFATILCSGVFILPYTSYWYSGIIFSGLMSCSWLFWYWFGRIQKRWYRAWIVSLSLVLLAVLCKGLIAIFIFYFPLLWLPKPLTIYRRLSSRAHLICLSVMIAIIVIACLHENGLRTWLLESVQDPTNHFLDVEYLKHLWLFPLASLLFFFPWIFFLWPAFCQAFRPIEELPVLCIFIRTIARSLFILMWFIPIISPNYIIIFSPLLGVLAAMNYRILIRRHGPQLLKLGKFLAFISLSIATVAIVYSGMDSSYLGALLKTHTPLSIYTAFGVGIFLAISIMIRKPKRAVWFRTMGAVVTLHLIINSTIFTQLSVSKNKEREISNMINQVVPIDAPIYLGNQLTVLDVPDLLIYLKHRLYFSEDSLDSSEAHSVYAMTEGDQPVARGREWVPVTTEYLTQNETKLRIWRGTNLEQEGIFKANLKQLNTDDQRIRAWNAERSFFMNFLQDSLKNSPIYNSKGFYGAHTLSFNGTSYLYYQSDNYLERRGREFTLLMMIELMESDFPQDIFSGQVTGKDPMVLTILRYRSTEQLLQLIFTNESGEEVIIAELSVPLKRKAVIGVTFDSKTYSLHYNQQSKEGTVNRERQPLDSKIQFTIGASLLGSSYHNFLHANIPEIFIYNNKLPMERVKFKITKIQQNYLTVE